MSVGKSIQHSRKNTSNRKNKTSRKNKINSRKHKKTAMKKTRRLTGGELDEIDEESNLGKKRERKEVMPVYSIGRIPGKLISNIKHAPEKQLISLVNMIDYGPQIVSLPVPPYRHAFLVDVQQRKKRIMVSDWGGPENKTAGIKGSNNYEPSWEQYSDLMIKLEQKYGWPIEYYPVDKELYEKSMEHNNMCSGGGCSHYIYAWKEVYYPNYS